MFNSRLRTSIPFLLAVYLAPGTSFADNPVVEVKISCPATGMLTVSASATDPDDDLESLQVTLFRYDSEDDCENDKDATDLGIVIDVNGNCVKELSDSITVTCTPGKWYDAYATVKDCATNKTEEWAGCCDCKKACGQVYCATNPDNFADIHADACTCAKGSIIIRMTGGPPNNFGFLLISAGNGVVTDPPGAQGDLCLVGAPIGRYVKDVGLIDVGGNLSTDVFNSITGGGGGNLPNPPGGNLCNPPGQTWNFQYWHRDGVSPSKFSKAISVTFR